MINKEIIFRPTRLVSGFCRSYEFKADYRITILLLLLLKKRGRLLPLGLPLLFMNSHFYFTAFFTATAMDTSTLLYGISTD